MTGLVWLVCSSDGVKFIKICLFCCLYASFAVDFHGLFKTIFKMKSLQQFFGGFYDMLPHSHMNVRILTKKHSMK